MVEKDNETQNSGVFFRTLRVRIQRSDINHSIIITLMNVSRVEFGAPIVGYRGACTPLHYFCVVDAYYEVVIVATNFVVSEDLLTTDCTSCTFLVHLSIAEF